MLDTGRSGEAKDVIINNPISLYCETNAAPPPTLTWYKDGRPLASSDRVLILPGEACWAQGESLSLCPKGFSHYLRPVELIVFLAM